MNPTDNSPHLQLCLDLAVPAGARLLAWSDDAALSVTESVDGRRFMLFAEPGARYFLMGFPEPLPDSPEILRRWYQANPTAQPVWLEVDEFGEAKRLPGHQPFPKAALTDPRFEAVRAVFQKERTIAASPEPGATRDVVIEDPDRSQPAKERKPAAGAPSAEQEGQAEPELAPVLVVDAVQDAQPLVLDLRGAPIRVEKSKGTLTVFATDAASFALAQAPDEEIPLSEFFEAHPQARAMAYTVSNGLAEVNLGMLASLERRIARRGSDGLDARWPDILNESEAARSRALKEEAVPARGLRRYVEERGHAPRAILGSDGTLYAALLAATASEPFPRVAGVLPDGTPAQVLRVDATPEERVLFAPVGGTYVLSSSESPAGAEDPSQAVGIVLRPGGDGVRLGTSERTQVWAEATPLEFVYANPPREQKGVESSAGPDSSLEEAIPSEPPADLWEGWSLAEVPPDLEETQQQEPEPFEEPGLSSTPLRWHGPDVGLTNLENWSRHTPRGDLWMAELLYVLADNAEELDAMGCLVPLQMLRLGYGLTLVDKVRLQRAVDGPFSGRLKDVRIFEVEGQSFFARDTLDGLRIVGPRGGAVKSAEVRAAILASYGRGPDSAIVEPQSYRHPSSARLSLRTARRMARR